jgi:hypothetical protein
LLLVGLASCDEAIARQMMAAGRMPNLAGAKAAGAWGSLLAGEPHVGLASWTTLATGCHPETHGVLDAAMVRLDGGGVSQAGLAAWQVPSLWQAVAAAGRRTLTVGWPATWPATSWPDLHVDVRFASPNGADFDTWVMPLDCVSPPALRERLRELRLHPTDVTGAMLAPFVPRLAELDQQADTRLAELAVAIAATTTLHAAATELLQSEVWDLACVHYPLLDDVQRRFGVLASDSAWGGVVDAAYAFADMMLGRLLTLVGPDTSVWLVSPNGLGNRRGVIVARGRWIAPGTTLSPVRLVDVAPTVLARFGLTMPTDGAVIRAIAPGRSQRPVVVGPRVPSRPDRHIAALRTLGYDDAPSPPQINAMRLTEGRALRARGQALIERGRLREAEAALRDAREKLPSDPLVLGGLVVCCVLRGDAAACRDMGQQLATLMPHLPWGHVAIAASFALEGNAAAAWMHMACAEERGATAEVLVRLGGVALLLKEDISAISYFSRALEQEPDLEGARRGLDMARELSRAYESRDDINRPLR